MSERILRWFGDRRNEKVLSMTYEHLELTSEAVRNLYEMVKEGSEEGKKKLMGEIDKAEMRADQIRRSLITELSIRELYPNERDDLMELVRAVDWIADWAREAGRLLLVIPFSGLPDEFRETVGDMCRENYACVKLLRDCIYELRKDPRKALEIADKVEMLEEDVDEIYSRARQLFIQVEPPELKRGTVILVNEFLDAVESVADWCENTADIARAIAVRVIQR